MATYVCGAWYHRAGPQRIIVARRARRWGSRGDAGGGRGSTARAGPRKRYVVYIHVGRCVAPAISVHQELDAYRLAGIRSHVEADLRPGPRVLARVHYSSEHVAAAIGDVSVLPVEGYAVRAAGPVPVGKSTPSSRYGQLLVNRAIARYLLLKAAQVSREARARPPRRGRMGICDAAEDEGRRCIGSMK